MSPEVLDSMDDNKRLLVGLYDKSIINSYREQKLQAVEL